MRNILNYQYKEIEFVCCNSDYEDSSNRENQLNLYNELKKLEKDTDGDILPYMQDFSEDEYVEISLAVIILNKKKYSSLKKQILTLAKNNSIRVDLVNNVSHQKVDRILRKEIDNIV